MSRSHNVQTPGATPTDPQPSTEQPQPQTPPAEAPTKAAKPARGAPTKAEYAQMRAAEVNPKDLTAPVLTRDGFVMPVVPPTKA